MASLAPIYTNFEGGARAEKKAILGQHFPKSAQKRLFWNFFKILPTAQKIWSKQGLNRAEGESSKNQFGRPKKKIDIIFERENPRSAPVTSHKSKLV